MEGSTIDQVPAEINYYITAQQNSIEQLEISVTDKNNGKARIGLSLKSERRQNGSSVRPSKKRDEASVSPSQ